MQISIESLTLNLTISLALLNPKSVGCDYLLCQFQVIQIRGFHCAHPPIQTPCHIHSHIHHFTLIAILAPTYYTAVPLTAATTTITATTVINGRSFRAAVMYNVKCLLDATQ